MSACPPASLVRLLAPSAPAVVRNTHSLFLYLWPVALQLLRVCGSLVLPGDAVLHRGRPAAAVVRSDRLRPALVCGRVHVEPLPLCSVQHLSGGTAGGREDTRHRIEGSGGDHGAVTEA
jgi:hypothetical protein